MTEKVALLSNYDRESVEQIMANVILETASSNKFHSELYEF